MAAIAASQLLVTLVPVSAFAVFVLAIPCIAAPAIFASAYHHIARNLHVFDSKHFFGLHANVSGDP